MSGTNFPNGLYVKGIPVPGSVLNSGKAYFVDPYRGSNGNSGTRIDQAFADLATAEEACVSGNNDVVYLVSSGTTAAHVTSYLTATLEWDKHNTHLIGLAAPTGISPRARVANKATGYTGFAPVLKVSANGCIIANLQVYCGLADATSLGAIEVTGQRNYFYRVHAAGIGTDTQDASNAYSLKLTGGDENLFEQCTIGLQTTARGSAANSELMIATLSERNKFVDCEFHTFAEANTHQFILAGASALEGTTIFKNCSFLNKVNGGATTMTEAFDIDSTQNGNILLKNCTVVGATDWEANTESGVVYIDGGAPTNNTSGLAVNIEAT